MDNGLSNEELLASLELAKDIAKKTGAYLKQNVSHAIIKNWDKDIKLESDVIAHEMIVNYLSEHSEFPILSEEDASEHNASEQSIHWIVDPLDGSLNYSRHIPFSAVSIALSVHGTPKVGVVFDFNSDELFSGVHSVGAWRNVEPILVSEVSDTKNAIITTGFPSYTEYNTSALETYVNAVQNFKKVRLFGSAALSLAYVACGRVDAYYEKDIRIWDVAAGIAIVEAAGGKTVCRPTDSKDTVILYVSNRLLENSKGIFFT